MPRVLPIAPEGWPVIATVLVVLGTVAVVGTLAGHVAAVVPLVVVLAFTLWFFRDPERFPPADERLVVSPADGRILEVVAGQTTEEGLPGTRISIFMSPMNVHVNRNPVSGVVRRVRHTPGRFRAAYADKASLDNERNSVEIEAADGRPFVMVQIAGAIARRIVCRVAAGERVRRGERMGMIMFGSRVDLWVPPGVEPLVQRGERVCAGTTAVARVPA
ncbi:MAG: phosphatidylserine decarboxylase family protein [Candidatus Binatia bacterium]